jgi:hypothetical protein
MSEETKLEVSLPTLDQDGSLMVVSLPVLENSIPEVDLPNTENIPKVSLPSLEEEENIPTVFLPEIETGENVPRVFLPDIEDETLIQVKLPNFEEAGHSETQKPAGPPIFPTLVTKEATVSQDDFAVLAKNLEDERLSVLFKNTITETYPTKSPAEIDRVFSRLKAAVSWRLKNEKPNIYDEAMVIDLFRELKKDNPEQYGSMMHAFSNAGFSEAILEVFMEDTLMTEEQTAIIELYITTNKKGEVLNMYNSFLIKLKKEAKTPDGKFDLTKLSPLELYLLSLASSRASDFKDDPAQRAEYENRMTIIGDPHAVEKNRKTEEYLRGLTEDVKRDILALQERIIQGQELTEAEKQLRQSHPVLFSNENQPEVSGPREEFKTAEEIYAVHPELQQAIQDVKAKYDKRVATLLKEDVQFLADVLRNGDLSEQEVNLLLDKYSTIWSPLFAALYQGINLEQVDYFPSLLDPNTKIQESLSTLLIRKAVGQKISPEEQAFLDQNLKEGQYRVLKEAQVVEEEKLTFETMTDDEKFDFIVLKMNELSAKIINEAAFDEFGEEFAQLSVLVDILFSKRIKELEGVEGGEVLVQEYIQKAKERINFPQILNAEELDQAGQPKNKKTIDKFINYKKRMGYNIEINASLTKDHDIDHIVTQSLNFLYKIEKKPQPEEKRLEPKNPKELKTKTPEKRISWLRKNGPRILTGAVVSATVYGLLSAAFGIKYDADVSPNPTNQKPAIVEPVNSGQTTIGSNEVGEVTWNVAKGDHYLNDKNSATQNKNQASQSFFDNISKHTVFPNNIGPVGSVGSVPKFEQSSQISIPPNLTETGSVSQNQILETVSVGVPGKISYETWGHVLEDYAKKRFGKDISGLIWEDGVGENGKILREDGLQFFKHTWETTAREQGLEVGPNTQPEKNLAHQTRGNITTNIEKAMQADIDALVVAGKL